MGKRLAKTMLAITLSIALVMGLIPVFPMEKVEAATVINEEQMTARVKDLAVRCGLDGNLNVSDGVYFTKNGKACTSSCSNCNVGNVVASSWFGEAFGFNLSDANKLPQHYQDTSDVLTRGYSCCGFANFALWYVGKDDVSSDLSSSSSRRAIAQGVPFTEINLRSYNLKIGDVIRCGGHSMMFLAYGSTKMKVLDCNMGGTCQVRIREVSYTATKYNGNNMGITRLTNYQPDATIPTISNVRCKDVDSTGFTVTCTVTDDEGVSAVYFPVWTDLNGQDDLAATWPVGTAEGNNVYSYRVNVSEHNNEYGTYVIHIYARDVNGAQAGPKIASFDNTTMNPVQDKEVPVVTNVVVSDVTGTGYTVTATATDDVGVTSIGFVSRRVAQTDDDWIWHPGTKNADGSWSYRVEKSEYGGIGGEYWTDVYAYDAAGNYSIAWRILQYLDAAPPVISNAKITSIDGGGYTVECTATDDVEIMKVQHATWTAANEQDDILADWYDNPIASATRNGDVYTFRVKDSDHNYERGTYITHIYAYDTAWNYVHVELTCDLQNNGVAVAEETYNAHTYKLIDDRLTWHEAKVACEAMGGHLVTINSAEEQQVIESMLPTDTTCSGYHIGGYTENEQSKWVTGESFDYSNWYEGQPDGTNGVAIEDVYAICTSLYPEGWLGKWNDIVADTPGYGYICEFEPVEITDITLPESEVEVGLGQTKEITASVSPSEGYLPPIIWTSENESIATISDGVITGVAAGTTTITAECGGKTDTCTVKVVKPFESITLNLADKTLFKNETCALEVSYAPIDANASKELVWTSANPAVATVNSNGVVTARGVGSTQITVALKNNEAVSATCTITVESYVVTFDTKGGSSIAPIECGKNETLTLTQEPTKEGYAFTGWFKDAECTIPWDMENDIVGGNITLYAGWMEYHEGLWIVDIPAQQYTGKAIKPEITVYHYAQKLESGKDYTVSYKNNTNAGDVTAAKAPTVTVKGKGNYTGKETANFTILAKDISAADVTADNLYLAANGKVLKPVPVVTWNNKKLKNNKDFTVAYPDTTPGAYQNNGTYTVRIVGKGNFTGERTVQLQITGSNLMSKVKVSKIPTQAYTGNAIEPEFTVKFGSTMLTKGVDYSVSYHNNVSTGTATAVLTGMGSYVGEKKVTFKIVGASISKAKVLNLPQAVPYTGKAIKDVNYRLQLENNGSTETLVENQDYTVSYKNNTNAGTATITFKGINGYSGTLKKTFKITPYNLGENVSNVSATLASTVAYMKGTTVPEPKVTCFGKALKKDKDYKLSYKNNKEVYTGKDSGKMPTVTITGKGNYTGSITLSYNIVTQDIGQLTMTAPDKVYQTKAGKHVSAPVIKDVNGKKLAAGKDYEKALVYTYTNSTTLGDGTVRAAGAKIEATDILPAGTSVTVTAKGINNYTGEISCIYRITQASISKAKGKIDAQIYTGKAIEPGKSDITLKVGKTTLTDSDYEIISYSNNVRKGTATVVVKGVGNYGGTKTIKFKIKSKLFSWWWR